MVAKNQSDNGCNMGFFKDKQHSCCIRVPAQHDLRYQYNWKYEDGFSILILYDAQYKNHFYKYNNAKRQNKQYEKTILPVL